MRAHIERARTGGVLGSVGGFSGLYDIGDGRVLAAGADGVGTKLKLAIMAGKHDTVGIDCVAMCVNDVVCCGAQPLFFLDYFASGHTDPQLVADVVGGVADGCVQAGCALLGGETAEMPGFYADGDFDLAGFAVGIAGRQDILDGRGMAAGDVLIGLASSGPHSNGYSLIRRVFGQRLPSDAVLLDALLTPTRIYVKPMLDVLGATTGGVRAAAHITGGGFFENIPRMLAPGLSARIDTAAWVVPAVFGEIADAGHIDQRDMFATFNMGIGMVLAVAADRADRVVDVFRGDGVETSVIGDVVPGDGEVLM